MIALAIRAALAALIIGLPICVPVSAAQEDLTGKGHPANPLNQKPLDWESSRIPIGKAIDALVKLQNENGSFGGGTPEGLVEMFFPLETFYAWQTASHGLAVMALAKCEETEERRESLEQAVRYMCTTRPPGRSENWDIDYVWSALYCMTALVEIAEDPRFADEEWQELIKKRAEVFYGTLQRNQIVTGGWAYYDDPPFGLPNWGTSFCTALVLPALKRAEELGWAVEPARLKLGQEYVRKCALPNGAYEYDLSTIPRFRGERESINNVKGSLGRIQVCNWGLRASGVKAITDDRIREGLEAFFSDRVAMELSRNRPIPHEGRYANAGYFYFFGHYYAAKAISLLPADEREAYHQRLRPHVIKTQREDGTCTDFLGSSYCVVADTAYLALTLMEGAPVIMEGE